MYLILTYVIQDLQNGTKDRVMSINLVSSGLQKNLASLDTVQLG